MVDDPRRWRIPEGFRVEIDPERIEETLERLRERVKAQVTTSRYTKVRLTYKGRQVVPDIPLTIFLATEGAAFWLLSPLGAVLVNLGAKAFLDVEFVHEADELVREGLAQYMDGELEAAESCYRRALDRRPDDPAALYNLGTLLRVRGQKEEALATLRQAAMGPEDHPDVLRASEAVERMTTGKRTL